MLRTALLTLLALPMGAQVSCGQETAEASSQGITSDRAGANPAQARVVDGLYFDRGEGRMGVVVPRGEHIDFDVLIDVALIGDTKVGEFDLTSGLEPYRVGLPRPGQAQPVEASTKRVAWVKGRATGRHLGYILDHTIETRYLPQEWPRVIYRDTQSGSENRRRELLYGMKGGKQMSMYRRDHHCKGCERREHFVDGGLFGNEHHCKKCKRGEHRVWVKPTMHEIPDGAVDMLTAIHIARQLVRSGEDEVKFPMLDKEKWWDVTMTRAGIVDIKTRTGTFRCRAIKLTPKHPDGTESKERFKGLFGIHGTLSIFLDSKTGVPVRIEGTVPVGPISLDVGLEIVKYSGTPKEFGPLVEAK